MALVLLGLAQPALAVCGGENERLCNLFSDGRMGCNAELVDNGHGICAHPDCGRMGERACAIFGRNSCDAGLADINGTCLRQGDCGGEGNRLCYVFADGRGGCNADLADNGHGLCVHPNCGRMGERACAVFGRNSCDAGLADINGTCLRQGDCGGEGNRLCYVFADGRGGCNADLVDNGHGLCAHPNCGRLGERACAVFGRNSCDAGLADINGTCLRQGDCGGDGNRLCYLLADGRGGCNTDLADNGQGLCTHPNCGRQGEDACAVFGRNSCDVGLVEFNHFCDQRGHCGSEGLRACLLGERATPGCDTGLVEIEFMCRMQGQCGAVGQRACLAIERPGRPCDAGLSELAGTCISCGGLGQRACAIVGRNSCNRGLVEVNDRCFTRGACGAADQRACLVGERLAPGCDAGLTQQAGMCHQCGALGQRACAVVGRKSCDPGLVEFNNTCLTRADCGAPHQRACLIGERANPGCNPGATERAGRCIATGPEPAPVPPGALVHVRIDPPLPFLLAPAPVSLIASVYDWQSKKGLVAKKIELFQSTYLRPGSPAPRLVATCSGKSQCEFKLAGGSSTGLPSAVSYMARVTLGRGIIETPVRIADLAFVGDPVRMDVAAERRPGNVVAQLPTQRTVDVVYYAGSGYSLITPAQAQGFADRLRGEHVTMLRASDSMPEPSSLAENIGGMSFWVSLAPAVVKHIGLLGMCEHSTSNPVPWGDSQGILHPNLRCRDWSAPGPFYSAAFPSVSWHELHHAAFGLSDEYCSSPTLYLPNAIFPNAYGSLQDCSDRATNPATCARIAEPAGCIGSACTCSINVWHSDNRGDDTMIGNGPEGPDDLRAARGKFDWCRAGGC
jgi:hypothetical protein